MTRTAQKPVQPVQNIQFMIQKQSKGAFLSLEWDHRYATRSLVKIPKLSEIRFVDFLQLKNSFQLCRCQNFTHI